MPRHGLDRVERDERSGGEDRDGAPDEGDAIDRPLLLQSELVHGVSIGRAAPRVVRAQRNHLVPQT
jgi:hypothetical protein